MLAICNLQAKSIYQITNYSTVEQLRQDLIEHVGSEHVITNNDSNLIHHML